MPHELINALLQFFERGGFILWLILLLSVLMWTLLIERYWFLHVTHPQKVKALIETKPENHVSDRLGLADALTTRLAMIRSLVYVLPLLGLLGTVSGMIETFDVLMVFGMSNPRGLSSGISQALLTTMAGLVTSLSGLYFISHLSHRVAKVVKILVSEKQMPQPMALSSLLSLRSRLLQKPPRGQETD